MPVEAAAEAQFYRTFIDGDVVQLLLESASDSIEYTNSVKEYGEQYDGLSIKFFRVVCELLLQANDEEVVCHFFENYCGALHGIEDNEILIPSITDIVRKMDWSKIGKDIMNSLGSGMNKRHNYKTTGPKTIGLSPLELTLRVIDGLESGTAQQALIKMATEKAVEMADKDLFTSNSIGLLWKWVIQCGDKSVFDSVTDKFTKAEPSLLGPSIQYLSQYLCANGEDNDKIAMLRLSVCKRVKWLKDEIDVLNKPFTWEMSEAEFPDNGSIPAIQAFLRGPEVSMTTEKVENFKGYQEAQNYAARIMRFEQDHCSFEMEGTTINAKSFVTITKTRKWFLAQQKQLVQHQTELRLLTDQYGDYLKVDGGDKKRICLDK